MKLLFNLVWIVGVVGVVFYVLMIRTTRVELAKCDANFAGSLEFVKKNCQDLRQQYVAFVACEKEAGFIPYSVKVTREIWGRIEPQYADKNWQAEVARYCP